MTASHYTQIQLQNGYKVYETCAEYAETPHTHNFHEIFMPLNGQLDYFVDGAIFPLEPKDFILISAGDPHAKSKLSYSGLKCFVIFLNHDFFVQNQCPEYEEIFYSRSFAQHKISAEVCEKSGFFHAFKQLENYTDHFQNTDNLITKTILLEMLYILNHHSDFSNAYISNPQVERILEYINHNYTGKISLDQLAAHTFLSKHHICRLFKQHIGYTINQYITMKRIDRTLQLVRSGKSILTSCVEAGFSDYSAFYKAFVKEKHMSPSKFLQA